MPYGVSKHKPYFGVGTYSGFGDVFDVNKNQWYQSPSVFSDTMDTATNWIADEATGGTASTISSVNGELKILNNGATFGAARRVETTVVGKKYKVIVDLKSLSASYAGLWVGSTVRGSDLSVAPSMINGIYSYTFTAVSATSHVMIYNTNTSGAISTWDNYAIYPINNDGSVDITSATPITESRNYLDAIVYADAGGQPTFVEQLPKIEYKKDMEVDTLKVLSGFDLGQLVSNVTTSRFLGATYWNTSKKPKMIYISATNTSIGNTLRGYVNGTMLIASSFNVSAYYTTISIKVNPNDSYKVDSSGGTATLQIWTEEY